VFCSGFHRFITCSEKCPVEADVEESLSFTEVGLRHAIFGDGANGVIEALDFQLLFTPSCHASKPEICANVIA
ncbi:hypothetical protein PQR72_35950, partial [Paraburkholderia madseniana]|uniref:hypothetical protein n=1 Tax=Paraburkholderia madseniana TaxID=2599607 RepID=UPI0038B8065F